MCTIYDEVDFIMVENKYCGLKSRNTLSDNLAEMYKNKIAKDITFIYGNHGCGKTYVLSETISKLQKNSKIKDKIHIYIPDNEKLILYNNSNKTCLESVDESISLPARLIANLDMGVSFTKQNNDSQFEQISSLMKSKFAGDILICLPHYSELDTKIKVLVNLLMAHNLPLRQKFKHNLYFLITDLNDNAISDFLTGLSIMNCKLEDYKEDDIYAYLKLKHNLLLNESLIHDKLVQIKKICASNLKLVDFLYVDFQEQDVLFFKALDKIIRYHLQQLKKAGANESITEMNMEDIILTASISLKKFAEQEIAHITHNDISSVHKGLTIAQSQTIIKKDSQNFYLFVCEEVRNQFRKELMQSNKERYLDYYNYYSQNEQGQYYLRAYYLKMYNGEINTSVFSLLIFAYIEAFKFNDISRIEAIDFLLTKEKNDFVQVYKNIKDFYKLLANENSTSAKIKSAYSNIQEVYFDLPLKAELTRAYFRYLYKNYFLCDSEVMHVTNQLIQYANAKLYIIMPKYPVEIVLVDEVIIRLRIIYDIAPFILDNMNNVEQFEKLYNLSVVLTEKSNIMPSDKNIAQYMQNVFNRKAFLFVNQTQCGIYYEKAKKYFYDTEIWDEYCLTLIGEAGTDIVIQKYDDTLDLCRQAKNIAKEKEITIPQIEKLNNNKLIADFLRFESKNQPKKCINYAGKIAKKLRKNLNGISSSTEFVIITNLCSLYLYSGDMDMYGRYKKYIENLLECEDISDIQNDNIDDFYRYYFAWFEMYKNIILNNWDKAEIFADDLNGFVPALFKKQEVFWNKKLLAVKEIIKEHRQITSYMFCKNLVPLNRRSSELAAFFCRGLMLSDLQYTSYD